MALYFRSVKISFLFMTRPIVLCSARSHILGVDHFRKSAPIPQKLTCKPDLSVVSFLPLMKTTILETMQTLSYFRLDTLSLICQSEHLDINYYYYYATVDNIIIHTAGLDIGLNYIMFITGCIVHHGPSSAC